MIRPYNQYTKLGYDQSMGRANRNTFFVGRNVYANNISYEWRRFCENKACEEHRQDILARMKRQDYIDKMIQKCFGIAVIIAILTIGILIVCTYD